MSSIICRLFARTICCLLLLISQQPILTRSAMRILNLFKVILENLPVDFRAEMMYTRFARSAFAHAHAVIKETRGMDKMRTDNVKMNRQTTDDARGQRFSLLFLLCFCMMLLLSGCGSEPSYELNETALAVELLENGSFDCELYQVKAERISDFISIDAPEKEILCMGNGTYADSFGIFTLADADAAKSALETVQTYLTDLQDSYQDYLPAEADKIANAVVLQKGRYVVFCVSPDAETMRETIEGAFVETEEAPNTDDADKPKNEEEQSETNGAAAVGQAGGNADGVYPVINSKAKINQLGNIAVIGDKAYELYTYLDKPAETYAKAVNKAAKALEGKTAVYDLLIPLSSGITLPDADYGKITSSDQKKAMDAIEAKLREDVKVIDPYEKLMQHRDEYIYFGTDHHWTADGAYYAYEAYCESKNLLPISRGRHEKREFDGFLGSFYNDTKSKKLQKHPDTVTAYEPISKNISMECEEANGSKPSYPVIYDVAKHPASLKYNAFLAGDHAYAKITNEDLTDGSSCVVVKESFGNAFVPFLVDHYQTVHVIDYRYWNQDLISFVEKKQADDLIFVNNLSMIRSGYLTGRLAQIVG